MRIDKELAAILCKLSDDDMFELLSRSNHGFQREHIKFVRALTEGYSVSICGFSGTAFCFDEAPSEYTILKPKRYCNGVELDDCLAEPVPDYRGGYFVVDFYEPEGSYAFYRPPAQTLFDLGIVYDNKESVIKHYKAILNVEVK